MSNHTLTPEIKSVLQRATVTADRVILPPGQLDRKLYVALNACLENVGGRWNRTQRAHLFDADPRPKLAAMLETGVAEDQQQTFQQFFTPPELARRLVELVGDLTGARILEPSAGTGRLIEAVIAAANFGCLDQVVAVELHPECVAALEALRDQWPPAHEGNFRIIQGDFLRCKTEGLKLFDTVLMNPPFSRGDDIRHIQHALNFLKPGGRLAAICANGPKQREALRSLAAHWEDLEPGAFKSEGTNVNAAMLMIQR